MGRTVGFIRGGVDTKGEQIQRAAILMFCDQKNFKVDRWYQKEIPQRRTKNPGLMDALLNELNSGDTLIVSELSKLARTVGKIAVMVTTLQENGVNLVSIKERININSRPDIQSKVIIAVFGMLSEIERKLISERTREGLESARRQGKLLGRPKGVPGKSRLDGREGEIRGMLSKGVTKANIARMVGVSWPALQNFIRTRNLA